LPHLDNSFGPLALLRQNSSTSAPAG
jgi:hypothetical protein